MSLSLKGFIGFIILLVGLGPVLADEDTTIKLDKNVQALHFREGSKFIRVTPAFEDYIYMMLDVCDAMGLTIQSGDCAIDALNGDVAGGAVAMETLNRKFIIYNRRISPMLGYAGANAVIAHEIGHLYCGHTKRLRDAHKAELEADRFAGAAMKRMRYTKAQATEMAVVFDSRPSRSHPAKAERIKWIEMGWEKPLSAFSCR